MAGRERLSKLHILACVLAIASSTQVLDQAHIVVQSTHDSVDDGARTIIQDASNIPERTIIICNAYANAKPIDVINVHTKQRLTEGGQLSYKSCSDFKTPLQEGDRLEFKVGNSSVGIFRATGLPQSKASLLLIAHRRDGNGLNAVFKSHAFAETGGPQIAIVDTYGGKEMGKIKIMDATSQQKQDKSMQRVEELNFNSVVALAAGDYEVTLQNSGRQDIDKVALHVTTSGANYVVMRTGLPASQNGTGGSAFPQELVVYGEQQRSSNSLAASHLQLSMLTAAVAILATVML